MKSFLQFASQSGRWALGTVVGLGLALAGATAQAHVFGSVSVSVPPVTLVLGNAPQAAVVYNTPVSTSPVYASTVYTNTVYAPAVYAQPVYSLPVYSGPVFPQVPVGYGVSRPAYPPGAYWAPGHHGWHGHGWHGGMGDERRHGRHFD